MAAAAITLSTLQVPLEVLKVSWPLSVQHCLFLQVLWVSGEIKTKAIPGADSISK